MWCSLMLFSFVLYSYVQNHDDGRVSYPLCFIFISPQGRFMLACMVCLYRCDVQALFALESQGSWVWILLTPEIFFCLKLQLLQLLPITAMISFSLILFTTVHNDYYEIYFHIYTLSYSSLTIDQALIWLCSSVVEHLHQNCSGHGFESSWGLKFS